MEIQKHLFRVTERTLKYESCKFYCYFFFVASLVIGIVQFFAFINAQFLVNHTILTQCFENAKKQLSGNIEKFTEIPYDYIVSFYDQSQIQRLQSKQGKLISNDYCSIIIDAGKNKDDDLKPYMQYSQTSLLLRLSLDQRQKLNVHNYSIALKYSLLQTMFFFIDKSQLNVNQILQYHEHTKGKKFSFSIGDYYRVVYEISDEKLWYQKVKTLLFQFLLYCAISLGTSFYIYATIASAPAVIILCLQCTRFGRGQAVNEIYKIFSWIGLHIMIRKTAANPKIRQTAALDICFAFLLYFLILYLIYYVIMFYFSNRIFDTISPPGLQEVISSYIAIIQFASIIYMRTRPFLKYFPKINCLLMLIFFTYGSNVILGYKKNLLFTVICLGIATFCYMVMVLEIPAINQWNPQDKYTPTLERPRIGFLPFFNLNWMNNLPDQWTRLVPSFGREYFSERQLSLVDRDFQQLENYLRQNPDNNQE